MHKNKCATQLLKYGKHYSLVDLSIASENHLHSYILFLYLPKWAMKILIFFMHPAELFKYAICITYFISGYLSFTWENNKITNQTGKLKKKKICFINMNNII